MSATHKYQINQPFELSEIDHFVDHKPALDIDADVML